MKNLNISRRSLLTSVTVAGVALALPQPASAVTFIDVPTGAAFATEINWLATVGISTGWNTANGKEYRPLLSINRDAMAAFLYRHAGSPSYVAPAVSPFIDVFPTQAFYKEICWLRSKGITTGWVTNRGTEYRPFAPINRDAMAAFLYRYAGSPSYSAPSRSPFIDVSSQQAFYKEMCWLYTKGISTGWSTARGAEYRPFESIKRDAMAAFIYRFSRTVKPMGKSNPIAQPASYEAQVANILLSLVNTERSKAGRRTLKLNTELQRVAQNWSTVMAKENQLYHNPNYSEQYPSGWQKAAENVAYNMKSDDPQQMAETLMKQWMASKGHRENILESTLTDFGAGVSISATGLVFACQNFAKY